MMKPFGAETAFPLTEEAYCTAENPRRGLCCMKKAMILFTRVPSPKWGKTRLRPFLSDAQCAALQTAFLQDIAEEMNRVTAAMFVAWEGDDPQALRPLFPDAAFFQQSGPGLGERMHRAVTHVLSLGFDACLLFGSDLPMLTAEHLNSAFSALERADVTLGPSPDGGYYLVGLKHPCAAIFENQSYGSNSVYERTRAAIRAEGLAFTPALPCADADTPQDLAAAWKLLMDRDTRTSQFLRAIFEKEEPISENK